MRPHDDEKIAIHMEFAVNNFHLVEAAQLFLKMITLKALDVDNMKYGGHHARLITDKKTGITCRLSKHPFAYTFRYDVDPYGQLILDRPERIRLAQEEAELRRLHNIPTQTENSDEKISPENSTEKSGTKNPAAKEDDQP